MADLAAACILPSHFTRILGEPGFNFHRILKY